jgi:hypothetical protein
VIWKAAVSSHLEAIYLRVNSTSETGERHEQLQSWYQVILHNKNKLIRIYIRKRQRSDVKKVKKKKKERKNKCKKLVAPR